MHRSKKLNEPQAQKHEKKMYIIIKLLQTPEKKKATKSNQRTKMRITSGVTKVRVTAGFSL